VYSGGGKCKNGRGCVAGVGGVGWVGLGVVFGGGGGGGGVKEAT